MKPFVTLALIACGIPGAVALADAAKGDARAGRALAYAECRGCHGMDGKGTRQGIPTLTGREESELAALLEEYRAGKKPHAPIAWIARSAKPKELRDIAAYYAAQGK